eukprot:15333787-Ditylum_brightwellii.AAC.1
MVDLLSHVIHQSASRAKADRWYFFGLVLLPVGHDQSAFILENAPVEVLAYLVVALNILGAAQHVAATGNMWDGLVVFSTELA